MIIINFELKKLMVGASQNRQYNLPVEMKRSNMSAVVHEFNLSKNIVKYINT